MRKIRKEIAERAADTACKICDSDCMASYDCPKKAASPWPLFGKETVCPLAKYDVSEKPKTDNPFGPRISLEDLFYVCANCKHANVIESEDTWEIERERTFETVCIDCPVQMCRDNILEARAEAAMS